MTAADDDDAGYRTSFLENHGNHQSILIVDGARYVSKVPSFRFGAPEEPITDDMLGTYRLGPMCCSLTQNYCLGKNSPWLKLLSHAPDEQTRLYV